VAGKGINPLVRKAWQSGEKFTGVVLTLYLPSEGYDRTGLEVSSYMEGKEVQCPINPLSRRKYLPADWHLKQK
jgi:hypothetical protein